MTYTFIVYIIFIINISYIIILMYASQCMPSNIINGCASVLFTNSTVFQNNIHVGNGARLVNYKIHVYLLSYKWTHYHVRYYILNVFLPGNIIPTGSIFITPNADWTLRVMCCVTCPRGLDTVTFRAKYPGWNVTCNMYYNIKGVIKNSQCLFHWH